LARPKKKPPMSLRAYARRRGVTAMAVSKAIKSGRLAKSVVRDAAGDPKIADPDLADREWDRSTDLSKAPGYVKQRASAARPPRGESRAVAAPGAAAPPPAGEPDDLSLAVESAREKFWKANTAELDYRERAGELVKAAEVKGKITDSFKKVSTRLLGIPTRAKQQIPHLTVADIGTIDELVREALEELYVEFEHDGADEDTREAAVG
jgi:hypothetical protein